MSVSASRMAHCSRLKDLRVARNRRQEWLAVIVWSICAVAGGAEGGSARETFGGSQREGLRHSVPVANGLPVNAPLARNLAACSRATGRDTAFLGLARHFPATLGGDPGRVGPRRYG